MHAVTVTSEHGVRRGEGCPHRRAGVGRHGEVEWGSATQDGGTRGEMAAAAMESGADVRPHDAEKACDKRASREIFFREMDEVYREAGLLGIAHRPRPRLRKATSVLTDAHP